MTRPSHLCECGSAILLAAYKSKYIVVLFSIKVFFLLSAGGYFPFVIVSFPNTVSRGDDTYGVFKYEAGRYTTFPFGCSCAGLEVYVSEKTHALFIFKEFICMCAHKGLSIMPGVYETAYHVG